MEKTIILNLLAKTTKKALNISTDAQFDRIYTNLSPKLSEYVFDQNASHVLQIVIERKGDAVKPMSFETSAETLHRAATDRVGSRAVQKAVDAFGAERSKALGAALVVHAKDLAVCSFGNYVLQTLLLRKFDDLNLKICVALCESFTTFACHKFGRFFWIYILDIIEL